MSGLLADKRDLHNAFKKHMSTYGCCDISIFSRRLILVYSVECGLKNLLLKKWGVDNPRKLVKDSKQMKILYSHNLEEILKELGQLSVFNFPKILTVHKDGISSTNYHQLYRYCVRIDDRYNRKEEEFEKELVKIADWIKGRL